METATLSTTFAIVVPPRARRHLNLRPGMKLTVLSKGRVIFLVPERPMRDYRGIAKGIRTRKFRAKHDRR
jgi:bifunctional DNA-binding transcriptional regulator/antitoxin component of YhaV-PrlF toxin-antitoxin module